MSTDVLKQLLKNSEIIISLLGRSVFKEKEVRAIVRKGKRDPDKYVEGYNACDGTHTVSQIAKIVGIKQPPMSIMLVRWEELDIIYEVGKPKGKFYKKLFPI